MNSPGRGVPLLYYPVVLLSAFASGMALLIWFRMYTTLFGIHQFSISSILITILICLATGSRIIGRQADKVRNPLVFFGILQAVFSLYVLLDPLINGWLLYIFRMINHDLKPTGISLGMIRIILTFLFLFIPLASLGGFLPVLGRFLIKHTSQAGNRISTILSISSTGMLAGFFVGGFLIVPYRGMHFVMQFSAITGLFVSALALGHNYLRKKNAVASPLPQMSSRVKQTAMLFRKRKAVLEIGAKLTRALLRVHAVHGFASAALLIIAGRMLNEYALTGLVYLQILILAVFLAGVALGSAIYRKITLKVVNGYLLMASLEILTGFAILLSFVLFSIVAPAIFMKAGYSASWWKAVLYQLIPLSCLLLLPAIITGVLLPLAGGIFNRRVQHSGRQTGKLGSLFYSGAIFGVAVTHYILMPLIGSYYTFFILAIIAILSGIHLLLRDSRLIRGFRLSFSAIAFACIAGILFALVKLGWINAGIISNRALTKEVHEGSSGIVKLHQEPEGKLALSIDGIRTIGTGDEGSAVQKLPVFLSFIMGEPVDSSLVIGFGLGLTAAMLEECHVPAIQITEIFPEVLRLSSDILSEENNDILTSSRVDISIEDGRFFLSRNSGRFDLITSGYTGLDIVPGYYTSGFYRACYEGLSDKGILTQVLPLRGVDGLEFRSLVRACTDVFPYVSLWYISSTRVLLLAGKLQAKQDLCTILRKFGLLAEAGVIDQSELKEPEEILGRRLMDDKQLKEFARNSPENSDNVPYVEFSRNSAHFTDKVLIRQLGETKYNTSYGIEVKTGCNANLNEIQKKIDLVNSEIKKELLAGYGIP